MKRAFAIVAALFALATSGIGQTVTGTLECRVKDGSGAVVPGAEVVVRNDETGLERTTKSNQEGYAEITFLPVGGYTLTVSAKGFAASTRRAQVELNTARSFEIQLAPASLASTVTVSAEIPLIDTSRGEIVNNIDSKTIEDRPLSSRNILSLVEMIPGFQSSGGYSGVNNPTVSSGSYVSFNGTGSRSAAFQIDGVNNDDSSEGQNRQNVNISAIKEFQVLANQYSAEFGRGAAVVLVQTKSGTNQIHGDAYEFLQNEKLNANTFFGNAAGKNPNGTLVSPRAPYRRNQFGYTVGAPILKNRLFIFHSFENTKLVQYTTFTRYLFYVNNPLQIGTCRLCVNPADHPSLQADMNFLQSVLDRFPKVQPNAPALCDLCYVAQQNSKFPDADASGRLDYIISSRDSATVRYQYSRQHRWPAQIIDGEAANQNHRQQNVGATETHMFSPTTFGEFRFGLGLRTTLVDIAGGDQTPIVRINNPTPYTITTLGSAGSFPIHRYQTDYQYVYNLSHVQGRQTMKAGIDIRRQHLDDLADNYSRGWWTFAATGTVGTTTRYEGWENFLRGYQTDFQKGYGNFTTLNRMGEVNSYVMDDIRATSNLTLNLGLRWEHVLTPYEIHGKVQYNYSDFNGLQPRFGIAWSPKSSDGLLSRLTGGPNKTVVKAGFGIFHTRIFQSIFSQANISLRSLPPYGAYRDFGASFTVADPSGGFVYDPNTYNPGQITITRVDPGLQMPTIQQYHVTIDRQLPGQMLLSVGWAKTRGIGLLQNQILNRAEFPILAPNGILYDKIDPNSANTNPAPGYISEAQPRTNQRRPDARYGSIYVISNNSWSYYNALRLTLTKRFSNHFSANIAYSWSKSIDTGSDVAAGSASTPLTETSSAATNRALSDFDQRHRLNLNFTYDTPWFARSRGLLRQTLGGWVLSTNQTYASGNPFTVTAGYDYNADGVSNDRPLLLNPAIFGASVDNARTNPQTGVQRSVEQLPLGAFFPTVSTQTYSRPFDPGGSDAGAIGRNTFFGQGLLNVDIAMFKTFRIMEKKTLTFRAECYGLTNTPHFAQPTASTLSASFGRITSTYSPLNYVGASRSDASARIVQLALRFVW
jgi:outer membrane receptor protein involved in Fe transport